MEGRNKPPSHAWHLSRRRCHREGLSCKWLTQPPEMQPDIQEAAVAPSAGQPAAAPSWSSESKASFSVRSIRPPVYTLSSTFSRPQGYQTGIWWEAGESAGPATCCTNTKTHMLLSYKAPTQASPAANTASAGQQVSCEKLLAAQEQLKTWLLLISVMDEGAMLVLALTETQLNLLGSR